MFCYLGYFSRFTLASLKRALKGLRNMCTIYFSSLRKEMQYLPVVSNLLNILMIFQKVLFDDFDSMLLSSL